jgi:hypothetical protein
MPRKQKNSLVGNINKRKKAGKSRPKKRSTVSKESYKDMQEGWPSSKSKRGKPTRKTGAKAKRAR